MKQAYLRLELHKILAASAEFAVLESTKALMGACLPSSDLAEVRRRLAATQEAQDLLFCRGVGRVEYFPPLSDELERAQKGSTLSCGELLSVCALLRSARVAYRSLQRCAEGLTRLPLLVQNLVFDERLEEDIRTKIVSEEEVSDFASERLHSLRLEIRALNDRIRTKLGEYLSGDTAKYLQENIITMRDGRFVLPVRTEYKRSVKGFIHDKSQSGATVFIEPEHVLELNNELRSLLLDEKEEIERILHELSVRTGALSAGLSADIGILSELDACYARAEYGYKQKSTQPAVNGKGIVHIRKGRHPLIEKDKVIPVSVSLGEEYDFLLISGPNTGGKTVSLKMVGLFCLMAACGYFLPAEGGTEVGVFGEVFCDVGDSQSIEENLSTFSSHIRNVIEITENACENSLVLLDELGGGTDPEEGQALARAVVEYLLKKKCRGIITTHYTALKEFAYATDGIENASMEFDSATLQPLYQMHIGLPGASNALLVSRRLGLNGEILEGARQALSEGARKFENILRVAEDTRLQAERTQAQAEALRAEWQRKVEEVNAEREKLQKREENLAVKAKAEARRIVHERTAEAEALLAKIEEIAEGENLSPADLIRARTLKNQIADKAFDAEKEETPSGGYAPVKSDKLKTGDRVFVQAMHAEGVVRSVRADKKEAEVEVGGLHIRVKFANLQIPLTAARSKEQKSGAERVQVVRTLKERLSPLRELNVIGLTVAEAIAEIDPFIDAGVVSGLEEIKILHGFGTGNLRRGIHEYLRTHRNVESFRLGKYGEGEGGITVVKLK